MSTRRTSTAAEVLDLLGRTIGKFWGKRESAISTFVDGTIAHQLPPVFGQMGLTTTPEGPWPDRPDRPDTA